MKNLIKYLRIGLVLLLAGILTLAIVAIPYVVLILGLGFIHPLLGIIGYLIMLPLGLLVSGYIVWYLYKKKILRF